MLNIINLEPKVRAKIHFNPKNLILLPLNHKTMRSSQFINDQPITKFLLYAGALFFVFEFFLHMFGLPLLEHDVIYLFTHDGYIGLLGLTYAALLILISLDVEKYKTLFKWSMVGIIIGVGVATYISYQGGYSEAFPVIRLDRDISLIGLGFLVWYPLTWIMYFLKK